MMYDGGDYSGWDDDEDEDSWSSIMKVVIVIALIFLFLFKVVFPWIDSGEIDDDSYKNIRISVENNPHTLGPLAAKMLADNKITVNEKYEFYEEVRKLSVNQDKQAISAFKSEYNRPQEPTVSMRQTNE